MEIYYVSDGTGIVTSDQEICIREAYVNIKLTVCDTQETMKHNHSVELRDETKDKLGYAKHHSLIFSDSSGDDRPARHHRGHTKLNQTLRNSQ